MTVKKVAGLDDVTHVSGRANHDVHQPRIRVFDSFIGQPEALLSHVHLKHPGQSDRWPPEFDSFGRFSAFGDVDDQSNQTLAAVRLKSL